MKNTFAKKFTVCALAGVLLCGAVVFSGCDDSSSAGGEGGSGGNRGGIPDTVETFMELSDYDCGKSQKCVATYLTEYHNMAVCDGDSGWVIGTLIEKMDCDFSSSKGDVFDGSSSSVIANSEGVMQSCSSEKHEKFSSSVKVASSSSIKSESSSSVEVPKPSSGALSESSSSSAGKEVSSSSEEMKTAWDYLNPNIDYGEFTDKRDGQVYKTVTIGDQTWMAQNLNYEVDSSWCYQRKTWNCEKYGRLYTWAAAIDSVKLVTDANNPQTCGFGGVTCSLPTKVQGVCPAGWHLPTDDEWNTLFKEIGGIFTAGVKFKSTSDWSNERCVSGYGTKDFNGTNDYGFSVLPAGDRNYYGVFSRLGRYAKFWSASEYSNDDAFYAYNWRFLCEYSSVSREHSYKWYAYSVRCVKDSE